MQYIDSNLKELLIVSTTESFISLFRDCPGYRKPPHPRVVHRQWLTEARLWRPGHVGPMWDNTSGQSSTTPNGAGQSVVWPVSQLNLSLCPIFPFFFLSFPYPTTTLCLRICFHRSYQKCLAGIRPDVNCSLGGRPFQTSYSVLAASCTLKNGNNSNIPLRYMSFKGWQQNQTLWLYYRVAETISNDTYNIKRKSWGT